MGRFLDLPSLTIQLMMARTDQHNKEKGVQQDGKGGVFATTDANSNNRTKQLESGNDVPCTCPTLFPQLFFFLWFMDLLLPPFFCLFVVVLSLPYIT